MRFESGTIRWKDHGLRYAAITDRGRVRPVNEDDFLVLPGKRLFGVADGMGGLEDGARASRMTLSAISRFLDIYRGVGEPVDEAGGALIPAAIRSANEELYEAGRGAMGSTVVLACFLEDQVVVAHVGDSRAYLWRAGDLLPVTRDHSVVYELFSQGLIDREAMRTHPSRHLVTRAIGIEAFVRPEVHAMRLERGEGLLLCSDGLSGAMSEAELASFLDPEAELATLAKGLVAKANDAGGPDNVAIILVKVVAPPRP